MSAPIIIGQRNVHLHHTTGKVVAAETTTRTIVKQGRYADLKGQVPAKGSTFEGITVVHAELSPAKGGMATLTVTGTDESASHYTGSDNDRGSVTYEVEMAQIEKPILCHKMFSAYAEQVTAWRDGDPALRAKLKYVDGNNGVRNLDGKALDAAKLIRKGVESYLVFAPVARKITRSTKPSVRAFGAVGGKCGKIDNPPGKLSAMVAGSWKWLKTADRAEETSGGGSQRVEEWTGADEWDKDLYG